MEDLISRSEAIDAIKTSWFLVDAMEKVIKLPSAQPEIIKCKDCAKREYCRTSTIWAVAPKDDWYCADAERRTDDTD